MTGSEAVPKPAPPKNKTVGSPEQKPKTPFVRQPHLSHRPLAKNKDLQDLKTFLKGTTTIKKGRRRGGKGNKA